MPTLQVFSEYDKLNRVMVGPADTLPPLIPINAMQAFYYSTDPPRIEELVAEHTQFVEALEANGVEVVWATNVPGCDQRDIRDIATVVGTKLLICRVKENIRKCEIRGLRELVDSLDPAEVIWCRDGYLEGGDIVIDEHMLFVAISQRTDYIGLELIRTVFGSEFDVVTLPVFGGRSLHLDTVFSVVSPGLALVYPDAFENQSLEFLRQRYHLIEVTEAEQFRLATNVLAITPQKAVADAARNPRVVQGLESFGLEIVNVGFSETNKIGGSFRCATLPLHRDTWP